MPSWRGGGGGGGKSRNISPSRALLGLGLFIAFMTLLYSFEWERSFQPRGGPDEAQPVELVKSPRRCWVFNHMNKAGGSTIKYMLQPWVDAREDITLGLYDSSQWTQGAGFARKFLTEENSLTWGAYTEGLRPYGGGDECKWFTIFRHPIPRVVSAYFYCKKSPVDGLCASVILRANETDLHTFAEHWGNFGLRQFSMAYVLPEDVLSAEVETQNRCQPVKGKKSCPGWYRLKLYLEGLNEKAAAAGAKAAGGSLLPISWPAAEGTGRVGIMKDGAILELLQPVMDLLSDKYAAVGILEQWDESIRLFSKALELPDFDWAKASHKMGKKNGNGTFKKLENEALESAWTDSKLKQSLLLDLALYDHAVSVHKKQVAQYGA